MITQRRSGTNWVKNLPDYMKYLNNKKREELGWQSHSEVYFGSLLYLTSWFAVAWPRIDDPQKLEKFRNRQKMISIDMKNYVPKQENERLIQTKGLRKEQLNILGKGIKDPCAK